MDEKVEREREIYPGRWCPHVLLRWVYILMVFYGNSVGVKEEEEEEEEKGGVSEHEGGNAMNNKETAEGGRSKDSARRWMTKRS